MRDEAKEELKSDPEILDEIKDEIRADLEHELLALQNEVAAVRGNLKKEQKNFKDMQLQFKPRKDDLDRVNKISREAAPSLLGTKISVTKEDWDFILNIAKQHAKISDTTLAALEKHDKETDTLKRCQSLYLTLASEVAALAPFDRSKLRQRVQDVLKDVEDWRVIAWLVDDLTKYKPSDLDEILQIREAKLRKQYNFAKQQREYNQPSITPKKAKSKSSGHEH